jgi:hypothetical protein
MLALASDFDLRFVVYNPDGIDQILGCAKSASHPGRALTVGEGGALSDLDNITVRVADVAARLAVLLLRFRDELGSSTFP